VNKLEAKGYSSSYIKNMFKALKSWLKFNDMALTLQSLNLLIVKGLLEVFLATPLVIIIYLILTCLRLKRLKLNAEFNKWLHVYPLKVCSTT